MNVAAKREEFASDAAFEAFKAVLDKITWRNRLKMVRRLKRQGLSPQAFGYPENPTEPAAYKPRRKKRKGLTHWPAPGQFTRPMKGHTVEETEAYRLAKTHWIIGKICEVHFGLHSIAKPATNCHHIFGRAGKLLMWENGWLPVCSECHDWIHQHPDEARVHGWLGRDEEWNNETVMIGQEQKGAKA